MAFYSLVYVGLSQAAGSLAIGALARTGHEGASGVTAGVPARADNADGACHLRCGTNSRTIRTRDMLCVERPPRTPRYRLMRLSPSAIERAFDRFRPVPVDDFVRLGRPCDDGYVVSDAHLVAVDRSVSAGAFKRRAISDCHDGAGRRCTGDDRFHAARLAHARLDHEGRLDEEGHRSARKVIRVPGDSAGPA